MTGARLNVFQSLKAVARESGNLTLPYKTLAKSNCYAILGGWYKIFKESDLCQEKAYWNFIKPSELI